MDDKIQIQSIAKINKLGYRIIPKGNKLIFVKQKTSGKMSR